MTERASLEEKQKLVNQLIGPNAKSALQLEREIGKKFSQTTLLRWKKEMAPAPKGSLPKGERPVERFTDVDKHSFVLETIGLEESKVDELLTKKNVSRDMLDEWKREFLFSLIKPQVNKDTSSIQTLQKENELLKARLEKVEKDKQLVEQVLMYRLAEERTVNS